MTSTNGTVLEPRFYRREPEGTRHGLGDKGKTD